MKKILSLSAIVLFSLMCNAQAYVSVGAQNKGVFMGAGFVSNTFDMGISYKVAFLDANEPSITSLTIGNQFNVNRFTVTASAGAGYLKYVNNEKNRQTKVDKIAPHLSIEPGYNAGQGRAFVIIKWCDKLYYGIGMRMFFI